MVRHTNARLPFVAALTLAAVFAAPAPAHGWNRTGHSVITYIAHKRLSRNARTQVDDLLREHFRTYKVNYRVTAPPYPLSLTNSLNLFTRASWWADDIRGDGMYTDKGEEGDGCGYPNGRSDMRTHRAWHFIDKPLPDDATLPKPSEPNLLTVTKCLREALKDPAASRGRKAYALIWLIHLVGDAHQPLHCTTRFTEKHGPPIGDAGGNLFQVIYLGRPMNLHSYWDALFGTSTSATFISREAGLIMKNYIQTEGKDELSEEVWVQESYDLAESFVYDIGPDRVSSTPPLVSGGYNSRAKNAASRRALLAGYRLAAIINEAFKVAGAARSAPRPALSSQGTSS